jgi:hypothetical protein
MSEDRVLMKSIMKAAENLIQCYDSELSDSAIRFRMKRIAEDLLLAAGFWFVDDGVKKGEGER